MNLDELSKSNEKYKIHKNDEELTFTNIKEILKKINYYYDTSNTSKLETLETELIKKLNIITELHNNNLIVIEKNIAKYRTLKEATEELFNNIDG